MDNKASITVIVTYGFILNAENKFLLVERAAYDTNPGIWEMPGGGLEEGEQPVDGAVREVFEETGLVVKYINPVAVNNYSKFSNSLQKTKNIIRIAFLCRLEDNLQQVKLSPDHSRYQWVSLAKLPVEMLSDFVSYTIQELRKQNVL